ncbi:MAG: hypothetical protein WD652_04395, partial [Acidimicrobiia bacterium]
YFISEETFQFILDAVHLIADQGWRLLPLYQFDYQSALWTHADHGSHPPMSLADVAIGPDGYAYSDRRRFEPETRFAAYIEEARGAMAAAEPLDPGRGETTTPDFERLRWFILPSEVNRELRESQESRVKNQDSR